MDQPIGPPRLNQRDPIAERTVLCVRAAWLAAGCSIAVGVAVLLGWSLGLDWITRIRPTLPAMPKVAALGFVVAGLGLLALLPTDHSRLQRLGRICAGLLLALGATVLLTHLTAYGFDVGAPTDGAGVALWAEVLLLPQLTALCFVLLGAALLLLDAESRAGWPPAQWLAFVTFSLALLPALGYSFGSTSLAGLEPLSRTTVHGAVALLALSMGVVCARPGRGAMVLFTVQGAGATIARRLIPVAVLVPIAVAGLHLLGERTGSYDSAFGTAIGTALEIAVLIVVILGFAGSVQRADRARQMEEQRFRTLLESSPDALLLSDAEGRILLVNARAETLFGFSREQLLGQGIDILVPSMQRGRHQHLRQHYQRDPQITPLGKNRELSAQHRNGSTVPVEVSLSPIHTDTGLCILSTVRDIRERKLQEQRLYRLNRMHALLSGVNALIVRARERPRLFEETCRIAVQVGRFDAAWIDAIDPEQHALFPVARAGEAADRVLDNCAPVRLDRGDHDSLIVPAVTSHHAAYSNDITTLSTPSERARRLIDLGYRSVIALPLLAAGEAVACMTLISRECDFFDADELALLNELAEDVGFALEHIGQQEQIDFLARFDPLTGLANRALFSQRLIESAQRGKAPLYLVVLCVARFRLVNDSHGREIGDRVLALIARRLAGAVPESSLLARIEADRFAFLVSDCAEPGVLATRVRAILDACFGPAFECQGYEIRLLAQAGITYVDPQHVDAEVLLRDAQAALDDAKRGAKRVAFHLPEMNSTVAAVLALEGKLRVAIERHQFVLHYQPKYDARSGAITGVEALIRWQDPEQGLVLPESFIGVLEDTGLILDVGAWVIEQAIKDHRRWRDLGLRAPRIAVNVSAVQLQHGDFVGSLRAALTGSDGNHHGLDLEITESILMSRVKDNIGLLGELRELGIQIAIDDFGTGYSSLLYIARLPLDTLKIDRSFITGMVDTPADLTIVSTVVSMAHQLGLKVVAEGVDAPEQANLLRAMHCDQLQGFLFSAALPVERLEALLRSAA